MKQRRDLPRKSRISGRTAEIEWLDRLTLGKFISEFTSRLSPSEYPAEELDNMLFFRNELTHRISYARVSATIEQLCD